MRNDRRQFYIYDLEIGARKEGASIPTMDDLVPIFQRMKDTGRMYPIRADTATMLVGDIYVDTAQQFIMLLLRLSDKVAPNSVTSDPAAGIFNVHTKGPNQGADFACHVLVSTAQEQGTPNVYTCAIERVAGIASSLVQRLLSKLLNFEYNDDAKSFSYPHPAGGLTRQGLPRTDRCCPHIELRGRPSDTLINDINNGQITGISLVKTEAVTPVAGAAYLTKKETELRLQINQGSLPANLWQSLCQVFKKNSGDYGTAKVSYRVPGQDRSVTVAIDASSGNLLEEMYVQSFYITNIFPLLDHSAIQIVVHLRDLAIPKFLDQRTV
ncbi:hypothetical protein [Acetobacter cerevisiae]|uniref:hypothetical protein n=1 Tax=Acetobacter cerevisiae TaxID=178900 RepID=UPI0020A0A504|nr:hypothetical protein [Acetobacter cerevisiae]MCP1271671.1 hypothetical protein [Acetobacter cerevisiae]MCP1279626.1 hypothetical protein [Acetobacter cerevisiae]